MYAILRYVFTRCSYCVCCSIILYHLVSVNLCSNFSVFVFKLFAYFYSGSATMLSEAIHSLADLLNQVRKMNHKPTSTFSICMCSFTMCSLSFSVYWHLVLLSLFVYQILITREIYCWHTMHLYTNKCICICTHKLTQRRTHM